MAEATELMKEGIKEGITMPGQSQEPSVAKEAAPTPAKVEETPAGGVQPPAHAVQAAPTEPKVRFEDNPGFKNVLRQRDSFKSELARAQEANERLMALLEKQSQAPSASPQMSEQEQAAKQLRQILGIDGLTEKLEKLDKRNSDYSQSQVDSSFDKEQEGIIKQCEKFGLDFNEVAPELNDWLSEHPYFGQLPEFKPGFFDIAFKALYFDKSTELAKKAAYSDQLKETEKLKKGNSESPNPAGTSSPRAYTGIKDLVRQRIEDSGGMTFPS